MIGFLVHFVFINVKKVVKTHWPTWTDKRRDVLQHDDLQQQNNNIEFIQLLSQSLR